MDQVEPFPDVAENVAGQSVEHQDDAFLDSDPLDTLGFEFDLGSTGVEDLPLDLADPVTDVVYRQPDGFEQLAQDLWSEIGPGGSLPAGPDGDPLPPPEVLAELQARTDDPTTLSVLANGIEQWQRAQGTWRQ